MKFNFGRQITFLYGDHSRTATLRVAALEPMVPAPREVAAGSELPRAATVFCVGPGAGLATGTASESRTSVVGALVVGALVVGALVAGAWVEAVAAAVAGTVEVVVEDRGTVGSSACAVPVAAAVVGPTVVAVVAVTLAAAAVSPVASAVVSIGTTALGAPALAAGVVAAMPVAVGAAVERGGSVDVVDVVEGRAGMPVGTASASAAPCIVKHRRQAKEAVACMRVRCRRHRSKISTGELWL